jgi:hypothetical protein
VKLGPHTKSFIKGSVDAVIPLISTKLTPTKEMNDSVLKKLLGEKPPAFKPEPLNREDQHVMKLFWAFSEIHGCIERLRHCETYVRSFPFSGTRVSRGAYLQFVVEGHLHEIYILRTRLEKLATAVARLFKSDQDAKRIGVTTGAVKTFLETSLEGLSRTRGSHVHEWRYSNEDIDRLELIRTLRRGKLSPFTKTLIPLQRLAAEESHERLLEQARRWNKRVSKVLEEVFRVLNPIVFNADMKTFRSPKRG